MQKRVIRIITGCGKRDSSRILFKKLTSLPIMSQNILLLLIFVVNNRDKFFINSEIHNMSTRHISNIHLRSTIEIFIKMEFTTQVLRFLIFLLSLLKKFLIIRGHIKMLYNTVYA
jgi:hypothetical protein